MNNIVLLTGLFSGEGSSLIPMIGLVVVFAGVMIFTSVRNKKQEKKDAQMRDDIQPGDEVTTIGGIIGRVVSVKGETFVLETTKDKTKIRFLKGAIRSVDVKAADMAAQIIEGKTGTSGDKAAGGSAAKAKAAAATAAGHAPEEKKVKKKRGKKHREEAEAAEAAATESSVSTESSES